MQSAEDYATGHLAGAVNITAGELMISVPVENPLTSAKKLTELMSAKGVGYQLTTEPTQIQATQFALALEDMDPAWYVSMKETQGLVNEPQPDLNLLDVRSDEEYAQEGKIPGALMVNYTTNFYVDGTFKDVLTTRLNYLQDGLGPEQEIVICCRPSMRATPVFIRLNDAGYRNVRIFDGAWLEWTSNSSIPIDLPDTAAPVQKPTLPEPVTPIHLCACQQAPNKERRLP